MQVFADAAIPPTYLQFVSVGYSSFKISVGYFSFFWLFWLLCSKNILVVLFQNLFCYFTYLSFKISIGYFSFEIFVGLFLFQNIFGYSLPKSLSVI
jgi:hypothetical protein